MPTFYSRTTAIQLSVSDLSEATTLHPMSHQSKEATNNVQDVTKAFVKGSRYRTLMEDPINIRDTQSHIDFLGKDRDMPFFMVQAGKDYFNQDNSGGRTKRPIRLPLIETTNKSAPRSSPDLCRTVNDWIENGLETPGLKLRFLCHRTISNQTADKVIATSAYEHPQARAPVALKPYALCLTVFLSSASFLRRRTKIWQKATFGDVKIDVYFNGELCGSAYVPERYRGEPYSMTELIVRFSGRRVGKSVERPWILVPPDQNPEGTPREDKGGNEAYPRAIERWTAISKALSQAARKCGRDETGDLSVGGEYLASLAKLETPAEVGGMQKDGGPSIGVIDVVVISGRGQKDDASCGYLREPTPIRVTRSGAQVNELLKSRRVSNQTSAPKERRRNHADAQIASQPISVKRSRLHNEAKPAFIPTASSDVMPVPGLNAPCLISTKPSKVLPLLRGGFDVADEPSSQSAKVSQKNGTASGSTDRPSSSSDALRSNDNQQNPESNMVPPRRRRSALLHELSALASDSIAASLASGESALPTRSRRSMSKPQTPNDPSNTNTTRRRASLPVRPVRRATSPGAHVSGRARLSQNARARARNDQGSFVKRHASSTPDDPRTYVPQKRYRGPNSSPPPSAQPQPKRARMPYEVVLDDKRTLAEEMAAIEEEAQKELEMAAARDLYQPTRATRSRFASGAGSGDEVVERPKTTTPTVISPGAHSAEVSSTKFKLRLNAPAPPSLPIQPTRPKRSRPSSTPPLNPSPHTPPPNPPQPTTLPLPPSSPNAPPNLPFCPNPTPQASNPIHASGALSAETADLSNNSCLTYAPSGVVRQVKGERGGWFVEEGVVMGVRFLVGG